MKKTWVKHNIPSKIQDHGCSSTTKTRGGDKWRRSITYIEQNQQRKPITILKIDATNSKSKWERKEIPPHALVVGIMHTLLAKEYDNWGTLKTEKIWKNRCFTWTWW